MWRYALTAAKAPTGTPVAISTPTRVQGALVADGYYVFSTSYGRHCYSQLKFKRTSKRPLIRVSLRPVSNP